MEATSFEGKYHKSSRIEYPIANSSQNIKLCFPSIAEYAFSRLQGRCMKIDHCQIEYRPLVPHNAQGTVHVDIHDQRLTMDHSRQAQFKFPITAHIKLNFFSGSYFSSRDDIPWKAKLTTTGTNMLTGTRFCSIRARLKLSTEKHSMNVNWKSPSVEILSGDTSPQQIDFSHVDRAIQQLVPCSNNTYEIGQPSTTTGPCEPLTTNMGLTFQQTRRSYSSRYSVSEDTRSTPDDSTIVDTPLERSRSTRDAYIHITPHNLADIVKQASTSNNNKRT